MPEPLAVQAFPHLAARLPLRHLTLRNRVTFGAHTANMSEQGLPSRRHLGYYRERARGGAGMVVVEPVPVHPTGVLTRGNFRVQDDAVVPGFRAITEAVHAEGAAVMQQLYHVGQHGDYDNSFRESWSPSGLPSYHDSDGSHAMNEREIEELIAAFVAAAVRAKACGFDGVELFAAYNAVIDQFWLPWSNRRDDRWGGTFENRMRFSAEVLRGIRAAVGEEFVVGLATAVDPGTPPAMTPEQLAEVVAWHDERELMDYVSVGTGSYFGFGPIMPTFLYPDALGVPGARALKAVVRNAKVQVESHIRTPENADYAVASGTADLVSIVRGQIADPHLVRKALGGRPEDVRGCISCNQMCWGRRSRDYWISCLVNPSAGREIEWGADGEGETLAGHGSDRRGIDGRGIEGQGIDRQGMDDEGFPPATRRRSVLVVGGGPAGLEAARVAAARGHTVTLAEAGPELGGAFRLAGLQPRRSQISDLVAWYDRQLASLGVTVLKGTPMDGDEVSAFGADTVVVATGSQPAGTGFQRPLPEQEVMPGAGRRDVHAIEDVLSHNASPGSQVVLVDDVGDWRGTGTAWWLAERGHRVTLVTGWPMVGFWIQRTAADGELRARLARLGVDWHTETVVTAWSDDGAHLRSLLTGSEQVLAADSLVLATTNVAETSVVSELEAAGFPGRVEVVGDALAPRLAVHAILEGRRTALAL